VPRTIVDDFPGVQLVQLAEASVREPEPKVDDVAAWLEMGTEIAQRMRAQIEERAAFEFELRRDAASLIEQADAVAAEIVETKRKLAAVVSITGKLET
jgi:hypothetical protein